MGIQGFINGSPLIIFTTLIGFAMLIMGRQILWIFIAGLGFALGIFYGGEVYSGQSEYVIFFVSTLLAIVGALLAYTLQRLAAGVGGFFTGWYLAYILIGTFRIDLGYQLEIIAPIIVGLFCSVLIMKFFDWGVIIASSIAGSAIIVSGMTLAEKPELIMLIMFSVIGITIQGIWFSQEK